jgi:hypothetical protein
LKSEEYIYATSDVGVLSKDKEIKAILLLFFGPPDESTSNVF